MSEDVDEEVVEHAQSDDDESDGGEDSEGRVLVQKLDRSEVKGEDGLSKRAALFFDQDIFAGIDGEDEGVEEEVDEETDETFTGFDSEAEDETEGEAEDVEMEDVDATEQQKKKKKEEEEEEEEEEGDDEDDNIEFVKAQMEENWDADDEPMKNGRPGKFIITQSVILYSN